MVNNLSDKQRFYDEEVAPILLDLCRRCHERGLSFISVVEWAAGDLGVTMQYTHPYGRQMDWVAAAARSGGNADALILHMVNSAREEGHQSALLAALGVPERGRA